MTKTCIREHSVSVCFRNCVSQPLHWQWMCSVKEECFCVRLYKEHGLVVGPSSLLHSTLDNYTSHVSKVTTCTSDSTGFLKSLRGMYKKVKECRLKSTRKESTEVYILAKGYLRH